MRKPEELKLYACHARGEDGPVYLRFYQGFWYYINSEMEISVYLGTVVGFEPATIKDNSFGGFKERLDLARHEY